MQFMRPAVIDTTNLPNTAVISCYSIAGYDRRVLCPTARYAHSLACCEPANQSALRKDLLVVYRLDLLSGDRARKASQIPACRSRPRCDCGRQSPPYTRLSLLLIQRKVFGPLSILAPFLLLAMLHRPPSLEYSTEPPVVCWPRAESTRPALPWIRSGTSLR